VVLQSLVSGSRFALSEREVAGGGIEPKVAIDRVSGHGRYADAQ